MYTIKYYLIKYKRKREYILKIAGYNNCYVFSLNDTVEKIKILYENPVEKDQNFGMAYELIMLV